MKIAIVGAGWAGLAAAVHACGAGHAVTVFEASRQVGGRARALPVRLPDGSVASLDNGQHILVGAYRETLALMRIVGIAPESVLRRLPLTLRFPDGAGLALPSWPAPLDVAAGVLAARGWTLRDKVSLLRAAARWRSARFECAPGETVAALCTGMTPRVVAEVVEPLCVAALNTPMARASGQVFLRVLGDTLFEPGGSNLLLPACDLGALFPEHALAWLRSRSAPVQSGRRVHALERDAAGWAVDGEPFDAVLLACPAPEAARLAGGIAAEWAECADALRHEPIATVYASGGPRLPLPMLALRADASRPAQFVFDRGQLGGPAGVLAFVVSACALDRETVQRQVLAQAGELGWTGLLPLETIVEKRATFACTPGLRRPPQTLARRLLACGDYVEGPYPATIEGAVRSARAAVEALAVS